MNTKQQISNLLYEISCYACAESIRDMADAVQNALDAGVFDCLVEHPGNKPPDDNRQIVVNVTAGVRRLGYCERGEWYIFDLSGLAVCEFIDSWQELPARVEETK